MSVVSSRSAPATVERARRNTDFQQSNMMMYAARMQYVQGHVDTESSSQDSSIWTIQTPEHVRPRNQKGAFSPIQRAAMRNRSRPNTAPEGVMRRSGDLQRAGSGFGRASRGSRGSQHFGTVVAAAMNANDQKKGTPGRATIQLSFAKGLGLGAKLLPLEKRLEMKRAEHKMKMMAEIAKQKRRSTFSRGDSCPLHSWKLTYQAGCWFWVDQVTGVATAAPPPEADSSDRSKRASSDQLAPVFDEAMRPADLETNESSESDSDETEKPPVVPPCGTGHVVYDSKEFLEFMSLLDEGTESKGRRMDLRPTSAPLMTDQGLPRTVVGTGHNSFVSPKGTKRRPPLKW